MCGPKQALVLSSFMTFQNPSDYFSKGVAFIYGWAVMEN